MNQPFTTAIISATDKKINQKGKGRFTMLQRLITCLIFLIAAQAFGQVQTFTANGTYTVPAGVYTLEVECWGGGGAGGGATGNPAAGGGGAGGAYVKSRVYVTPGNTFTVTVGGIKTATTNSSATTNKGNPSWFGTVSTVFADGGAGGAPATANSTGGSPGVGTTTGSIGNLVVYAGGSGGNGNFISNISGGAGGGGAGSTGTGNSVSILSLGTGGDATSLNGGAGANGVANSTIGAAGNNYGAGGSGGKANSTTDRAGGTGAQGLVIVTPVSPANDDCTLATSLTLNGSAETGNIANAANSVAACTGAEAYDVWYRFIPTCSGSHTITVDPSNSFDAVVQLYTSCGGTAVVTPISGGSCVNAGGDNVNETPAYNLTAGITYYVRVYDYNATATGYPATTTFTIAVSAPPLPTTANAGADQTGLATCGATALTLGANNPTSGTGAWSIVSGTGGSFVNPSSFNSTFNGTLGSTYTLRWTISTSGCTPSTDDVVVAFNLNPTANAGPDQTSSATCGLTTVTLAGSMNAGTGVWSVISGTGGTVTTPSSPTSTFTGTAGTTYTLRWTVTNSPCTQTATDDVIITFNTNPVLTITNPAAVCSNSAGANLTAAAVTTGSTGSGTLSYWTNSLGTISLSNPSAVTTAGIYYIRSTTAAGCVDIEPVTVTVTPLPLATFSYTGSPYCSNATNPLPTFSGGGVAGTFSSVAGLAFVSATTGQINLSASTAGTYTVTNTIAAAGGCPAVTATSTVTETNAPSATISYAGSPFCRTTASGAVTRTGTTGGTYSSTAGLTINATTGTITPTSSTAGTYTVTYTVAASGGCAVFTTTASVTITAVPVATFSYTGTPYCSNTANPSPTFSGGGVAGTFSSTAGLTFVSSATGQLNLSGSTAGTYTVTNTIAAAGGCAAVTATSPITITALPVATFSYATPICKNASNPLPTLNGVAGTFTSTAGLLFVSATTGQVNLTTSTAGTYTVTNTVAATGGCAAVTATSPITITTPPTATITYAGTPFCTTTATGAVTRTGTAGGTYSSTAGLTINASTGAITPTSSTAGTYTVTYTVAASAGCAAFTTTASVTINAAPSATITYAGSPFCRTTASGAVTRTGTAGGTYSSTAGLTINASTGAITPTSSTPGTYTVTYTVAASGGCAAFSTTTSVTINAVPVATFSYTQSPICKNGSNPLPTFSGGGVAGVFTSTAGLSFVSATTGQINLTNSTVGTYTVTNTVTVGGCVVTATSPITITAVPAATIAYTGTPFCVNTTTAAVTSTGTAGGTYSATPAGLTINASTGTITPTSSTPGTYTVTYTVAASGGCAAFSTTTSVTIVALPVVSINANYCTPGGGIVRLTASPAGQTYLWNTGAITQVYDADVAGTYTVTVTNSSGCVGTSSVNVATELVTNGNFSAGNTGFTSPYFYQSAFNLYPEGYYSVGTNANSYHDYFFGTDHTTGSGNFMIINGSGAPIPPVVWQQTVTVQPNTTYYFSAWTMSVNDVAPFAKLRFAVNDVQVGTIASPGAGPTSTAGPFNWVRFYGTWTSGPTATTAEISILDIETAAGGNDFGLDDISFGTLSPAPFTVTPNAGVGGNVVCEGSPITIYSDREGGMSPFTYSWTGPNGFTSNQENPFVSGSATAAMAGNYTLSISDAQLCTTSTSFALTVNALPTNLTPTAVPTSLCSGVSSNIQITLSQSGVSYQLRNNTTNALVGVAVAGTGGTISLPTGSISTTTTFNVLATNTTTGCARQLSTTPTVTVLPTPVLVITNQASCTGSINLTLPAVTAGSTGGGTLTYWTNAACTTAVATPTAVGTGTYFIRSLVGSCSDIEPVVVSVGTLPVATFNYTGSPFCSSSADPLPTFSGGGVAGVFSSTTGAVFVSTSTGQIDLSATPAGTHTITNTITPLGACSPVSVSRTIVVTAHPSATFSYGATTFCQNANTADPLPVFGTGASAGTFSSSFGLTFTSASTGQIDISASTPGSYAVTNSRAAAGGCPAVSATSFIYINPYTFSGGVVTTASPTTICSGQTINLTSQAPIYLSAILREDFNSLSNNWVTTNASTGGTPANAAFTLRADGYSYDGLTFDSNDGTQFYMTNSRLQGSGGTTATTLRSPSISTVGYASLALDFFQYFRAATSGDVAKVQVSVDGFNWIDVATYTTTQGASNAFSNAVVNLDDYIGLPSMFIRFKYDATNDRYWAIDNVSVTGYSSIYNYAWSSSPLGFINTVQNPTATPAVNTSYTATATNSYGCSATSSASSVTVNPSPTLSSTLTPTGICSNTAFTYTPTSATTGVTYSWTRAAVAGISNAAVTTPQSVNPNETLINTTSSPIDVVYSYVTAKNGCSTTQNVTVRVNASNVWNGSQSTNWFTPSNWCISGSGIPTATTTALIPSVAVTGRNPIIDNAQGTNAVTKNLTILSGGGLTINGNASLAVWGTWNNSGTFTANSSTVTFRGATTDSIIGSDTQQFFNLTLDKGIDTTTVLKANVDVNIANTLALTNGLYNQNEGGGNITNALTISNKSGIDVTNNATLTTGAGVTNSGLLRVTNGTIVIGGSTAHNLLTNAGGRLRVSTGKLAVAGNITNTSSTSRINGGIVEVGGSYIGIGTSSLIQTAGTVTLNMSMASSNSNEVFDVSGTSTLNLTGGDIILQDGNGGDEVEIESGTGTKTFSALHNFQLGNDFTLSSSTFEMEIGSIKLGKLTVYNADALVAKLNTNITVSALVLNSVIDLNSYRLEIDNPSVNAITGNSYIKSETQDGNSKLQWNVGNSTGSYVFPFGNAMGTTIPFTFNITTAGAQTTGGNITVATYPTTDNNLPYVSGVTNMTMENGTNGSLSTLDRWWVIDADNYTTKPVSNMTFRYADIDMNGNPFLAENSLKAQRWDVTLNNGLGGWNPPDFFGTNTVNITTNTVTVNNVTNYSPWVLHDDLTTGNAPLPIELLSFAADCDNGRIRLSWETATEVNNDYFTIQRSLDLVSYTDIAVVSGAGNSNAINGYEAYDNEPLLGKTTYYRLMQTDFNGEFETFAPVSVSCSSDLNDVITLYPNPAATMLNVAMNIESEDTGAINIYNELGQLVKFLKVQSYAGSNNFTMDVSELPNGQYYVCFAMQNKRYPVQKLVVIR